MPSPAVYRTLQNILAVKKPLAQTYRGYKAVRAPITTQLVPRLPAKVRPFARGVVGGTGATWTAAQLYGAYDDAGTQVADTAKNLAMQAGIQDPKTVQEIGDRARGQMLPLAYRAVAPGWLGGDTTPAGQALGKHIRTIAAKHVLPTMWRPSQAQAEAPALKRVAGGVLGNPVSAVSSLFVDPRPGAKELWHSIAPEERLRAAKDIAVTLTRQSDPGPILNSIRHIVEPAKNYYSAKAQQFRTGVNQLLPRFKF